MVNVAAGLTNLRQHVEVICRSCGDQMEMIPEQPRSDRNLVSTQMDGSALSRKNTTGRIEPGVDSYFPLTEAPPILWTPG